ncbi:hypothetical protein BDV96DRAFT_593993 [Lophiotrema nucula]|uniref:Uncharacterized protein n=1 Tax=Lophiotrema nucula TaxID=690887 RepID=A0A6A5ZV12_9PLEO|nr:hypothetical protein BDV96DRAFT_593993 [Lophiotrema nucula]
MENKFIPEDGRLSVLIIGPTQNGKSTFINRIISLAINKTHPTAVEGNGSDSETKEPDIYDLDVPITDYYMADLSSGKEYDAPHYEDEDKILAASWWKKQTKSKFRVEPRMSRNTPILKLRLIDTPGLDDGDGQDFENMSKVLAKLNGLAKSPNRWEAQIAALVLVYNANSAFTHSFQTLVKHYQQCMPNLFGNLAIVNTHFSITTLSQKKQHFVRERVMGKEGNARRRIMKEREESFAELLGTKSAPTHFFIDNKPKHTMAYDELVSCNLINEILTFWSGCQPMKIKQMRLIKNRDMQAIDAELQGFLTAAVNYWTSKKSLRMRNATMEESYRSELQQRREGLNDDIARIETELERYDNKSEFFINTYQTSDSRNALELTGEFIFRTRVKGCLPIKEDNYGEFSVKTQNVAGGRWTSESMEHATKTWKGNYELDPSATVSLIARSYTTNREVYKDIISSLRSQLRRCLSDKKENDTKWDTSFADASKGRNSELEELVTWITASKDLVEILEKPNPPLDIAFDKVSRERYAKKLQDITINDLFAFVNASKPFLVGPLRAYLALAGK